MIKERNLKVKKSKNKNINKILILVFICVLIILIYQIIHTYAVFQSDTQANVKIEKGIWNININGVDVTKGINTNFVIDNINTNNEHTKPGKIAPGDRETFQIIINPKNTDVSVRYDITLSGENTKLVKEIKEVQESTPLIKTANNTYTGIIPLEKIKSGAINKINIVIEWLNDESNNKDDTIKASDSTAKFQIPITVHLEQYLGENITPIV